jgi:hypothetical protein
MLTGANGSPGWPITAFKSGTWGEWRVGVGYGIEFKSIPDVKQLWKDWSTAVNVNKSQRPVEF